MKKHQTYFSTIAVALLAAACSQDAAIGLSQPEGQTLPAAVVRGDTIPLNVTCLLSGEQQDGQGDVTRATFSTQDETHVTAGRTVYVWADEHLKPLGLTLEPSADGVSASTDCREYIAAWTLTSNGSGGWTGSPSAQYYTPSGYPIDLYALCGNFHGKTFTPGQAYDNTLGADNTTTWAKLTTPAAEAGDDAVEKEERPLAEHTVMADQTTSDNYYQSDLLYGRAYDREPQVAAQPVIMSHLMSKIEAYIILDNGFKFENVYKNETHRAQISVVNTKRTARITLRKQAADGTVYNRRVEPKGKSGDVGTVTLDDESHTIHTDYFSIEAVAPDDGGTMEVGGNTVDNPASPDVKCLMQYASEGVDVQVPTGTGFEEKKAYAKAEAVVVPQHVYDQTKPEVTDATTHEVITPAGVTPLLNIELPASADDSGTLTYQFTTNMTLNPGCRYIFYITLRPTKIDFNVEVKDWKVSEEPAGDLIIQ